MSQDERIESLVEQARKLHPIQLGLVIGIAKILQRKVVIARLASSSIANNDFMIAYPYPCALISAWAAKRGVCVAPPRR